MTKENHFRVKFIFALLIAILIMAWCATRVKAQTVTVATRYDTLAINTLNVAKYVEEKSSTGKVRYYAVYNDKKNEIYEIIPVSQALMSYIRLCNANDIVPNLGVKLKNGEIVSLVKYKSKYIRRK